MLRSVSSSSGQRALPRNKAIQFKKYSSFRFEKPQGSGHEGSRHYLSPLPGSQDTSILDGITMRLMPLGGSITLGVGSSDRNGYRKALYDTLQTNGCDVHMVGSRQMGSMGANSHEGWRGFRIDQVEKKAKMSIPKFKPTILTVNAGSNDCLQDFELESFGKRTSNLLEYIWSAAPKSTVILSTLVVNADSQVNSRILSANEQIRSLIDRHGSRGRRIVLADMYNLEGPGIADMISDDTHPNDVGFEKMAGIWFSSIQKAAMGGFIHEPEI